jgi:hypothetical protein
MMRLAGISAFFILATGCGVGDDVGRTMTTDPNPNGRVCGATLATSGSFTPDAANPPPTDYEGCWPVGMWTFTVTVADNTCSTSPAPLSQYQMKGIVMPDQNGDPLPEMTYVTAPGPRVIAKYSEGGSGLCEGELDLYSDDGTKVWLLKPELNADNTITGDGEYGEFTTDQFPNGG